MALPHLANALHQGRSGWPTPATRSEPTARRSIMTFTRGLQEGTLKYCRRYVHAWYHDADQRDGASGREPLNQAGCGCLTVATTYQEGTWGMRTTNWSPRCEVVADGQGICSHVGAAFLAAPAGRLRLIAELAVAPAWGRRGVNNRGQVLRNPATLRDQPDLFGRICSTRPPGVSWLRSHPQIPGAKLALWSALGRSRWRFPPPRASLAARPGPRWPAPPPVLLSCPCCPRWILPGPAGHRAPGRSAAASRLHRRLSHHQDMDHEAGLSSQERHI
jgi:hypothetical protein